MNNSKPFVTALICNYNYGRFLAQAIDSALNQTWEPIEVLVVDDGSTDESRSVLERYRGRIKVILKENGGQASAFNAGIAEARGEIICFLDSDDFWFSDKVEATVAKYKEAPWGLVCHDLQEVNEHGINIHNKTYTQAVKICLKSGDVLDDIVNRGFDFPFSPTSGMSLPKKIANELLPLPEKDWQICADVPLAYSAICHAPVGVIDKPLGAYRIHTINNFVSLRQDKAAYHVITFLFRIKRYFFIKDYITRTGQIPLKKELHDTYRYFRLSCFIVKKYPWRHLSDLWKRNIDYHFNLSQNFKLSWLHMIIYLLFDTLLSTLFFLHLPTPYSASRKHFQQKISQLDPHTKEYLYQP
jgi:glycosyltransferase involved in cell wall biosynthesis